MGMKRNDVHVPVHAYDHIIAVATAKKTRMEAMRNKIRVYRHKARKTIANKKSAEDRKAEIVEMNARMVKQLVSKASMPRRFPVTSTVGQAHNDASS